MATMYPHQHDVQIHRETLPKSDFITISKKSFAKAYKRLKPSAGALALYMWLVGNKNGYKFGFSPSEIVKHCGIPLSTIRVALKRLETEGYLVKRENSATRDFYETSRFDVEEEQEVKQEKKLTVSSCEKPAKHGEFVF